MLKSTLTPLLFFLNFKTVRFKFSPRLCDSALKSYLSKSARMKSIAPSTMIRSEIIQPLVIFGNTCM